MRVNRSGELVSPGEKGGRDVQAYSVRASYPLLKRAKAGGLPKKTAANFGIGGNGR